MYKNSLVFNKKYKIKSKCVLKKLEKRINKMNYISNNINKYNSKINNKIKLLIIKGKSKIILPYLCIFSLLLSSFCISGSTPFLLDKRKKYMQSETSIDSNGSYSYSESYNYIDYESYIRCVCPYDKVSDGYIRKIMIYKCPNYTSSEIIKIFNNIDNCNFNDLFNCSDVIYEEKSVLGDFDNYLYPYYEAFIYTNNSNYYMTFESKENNIGSTMFFLSVLILSEMFYFCLSNKSSKAKYNEYLLEILNNNPLIEDDSISLKLSILNNNYERLRK